MSATFATSSQALTLTFDRAIDISAMVGSAIIVDDNLTTHLKWAANGAATLSDPRTVHVVLGLIGPAGGSGVALSAVAGNGIVASNDGGAWAGVTGLALPFG